MWLHSDYMIMFVSFWCVFSPYLAIVDVVIAAFNFWPDHVIKGRLGNIWSFLQNLGETLAW